MAFSTNTMLRPLIFTPLNFTRPKGNDALFEKWEIGDPYISLGKRVFKRIIKPNNATFFDFWSELCSYSHASIYSMQVSFEFDNDFKLQIKITYELIQMLLEMNYHLLGSHLIDNKTKGLVATYSPERKAKSIKLRKKIKKILKLHRTNYLPGAKKLINNYKSSWITN